MTILYLSHGLQVTMLNLINSILAVDPVSTLSALAAGWLVCTDLTVSLRRLE